MGLKQGAPPCYDALARTLASFSQKITDVHVYTCTWCPIIDKRCTCTCTCTKLHMLYNAHTHTRHTHTHTQSHRQLCTLLALDAKLGPFSMIAFTRKSFSLAFLKNGCFSNSAAVGLETHKYRLDNFKMWLSGYKTDCPTLKWARHKINTVWKNYTFLQGLFVDIFRAFFGSL